MLRKIVNNVSNFSQKKSKEDNGNNYQENN
jgi:hypothetical protein